MDYVIARLAKMNLFKYFKPALPSPVQIGVGESATAAANKKNGETHWTTYQQKEEAVATYTDEDRGRIGRYAVENGNIAALKCFKSEHKDVVESTVQSFKKKYLAAVAQKRVAQDYSEVSAIPSLK